MAGSRREALQAGAALALGGTLGRASAQAAAVDLTVNTTQPGRTVNPLVLGHNFDWTNKAQGMYVDSSLAHPPGWLALADRLAPRALRYPGGTNADFFRWKQGLGPVAQRGNVRTIERKDEQVLLGTDEFLAFCRRWKSEPLITVNVATAPPEEAADWVRYCNRRAGSDGPRVRYWEIGNEPYLDPSSPATEMTPAEFGRRANACIRAMKAVDPTIECGLPLRTDTLGAVDGTKFKGFNNSVLAQVSEPFEWVASHGSYYPVTFDKSESPEALFGATMAGTRVLQQDMDNLRALMRQRFPQRRIRLAYTEYNALYSLDILRYGLVAVFTSKTDRYIESMAAALYVADALRCFTQADDLLMANFWAICGNWWFGAIGHDHQPRPQFHVLEAWRDFTSGQLLPVTLASPAMATGRAGFVPAYDDTPQVAALALDQGDGGVRLMVINRHASRSAALRLKFDGLTQGRAQVRTLSSEHYFGKPVRWSERSVEVKDGRADLLLGQHALAFVHLPRR
jgi:alpha-L-arabinofuranosidase